jgi:hypothetical protein
MWPLHVFAHICSLFLVAYYVEAMPVAQDTSQLVEPRDNEMCFFRVGSAQRNVAARFVLQLVSCVHGSTQVDWTLPCRLRFVIKTFLIQSLAKRRL